mmetsp:Transcript_45488/g.126565  ORF Transcript_45488/g.126565 Transcript_45488/m.126565 type:complete len:408 (+) Transcript_45488:1048-2271(+)
MVGHSTARDVKQIRFGQQGEDGDHQRLHRGPKQQLLLHRAVGEGQAQRVGHKERHERDQMAQVVEGRLQQSHDQLAHLQDENEELNVPEAEHAVGDQAHERQQQVEHRQREHAAASEPLREAPVGQRQDRKPANGRHDVRQRFHGLRRILRLRVHGARCELQAPVGHAADQRDEGHRSHRHRGAAKAQEGDVNDHGSVAGVVGQGLHLVEDPPVPRGPAPPDRRFEVRQRLEGLAGLVGAHGVGVPRALGDAGQRHCGPCHEEDRVLEAAHLDHRIVLEVFQDAHCREPPGRRHHRRRGGHSSRPIWARRRSCTFLLCLVWKRELIVLHLFRRFRLAFATCSLYGLVVAATVIVTGQEKRCGNLAARHLARWLVNGDNAATRLHSSRRPITGQPLSRHRIGGPCAAN